MGLSKLSKSWKSSKIEVMKKILLIKRQEVQNIEYKLAFISDTFPTWEFPNGILALKIWFESLFHNTLVSHPHSSLRKKFWIGAPPWKNAFNTFSHSIINLSLNHKRFQPYLSKNEKLMKSWQITKWMVSSWHRCPLNVKSSKILFYICSGALFKQLCPGPSCSLDEIALKVIFLKTLSFNKWDQRKTRQKSVTKVGSAISFW